MTCPQCGEAARFVEYRGKRCVSILGDLELERAYYHCQQCGHGHFPGTKCCGCRRTASRRGRKN